MRSRRACAPRKAPNPPGDEADRNPWADRRAIGMAASEGTAIRAPFTWNLPGSGRRHCLHPPAGCRWQYVVPKRDIDLREGRLIYVFLMLVVAVLVTEAVVRRLRQPRMNVAYLRAALVSMVAAFAAWILDITRVVCVPDGRFQAHALWHVLMAVVIGFVYMYYRSEAPSQRQDVAAACALGGGRGDRRCCSEPAARPPRFADQWAGGIRVRVGNRRISRSVVS